MAQTKKTTAAKTAAKAADTKTAEVKAVAAEANAEDAKKTVKKTTTRKTAVKKAPAKKEVEEAAQNEEAAVKATVKLQFGGREISMEELVQNAKNVWQYDMNKNPEDFKTVELYVKPEEQTVYFVINGGEQGCFSL